MKRIREVILASSSPQKRKLMISTANRMGVELTIERVEVEEIVDEDAEKTAIANALLKLREVEGFFVVSSDVFAEFGSEMLFKPKDKKDAKRMLNMINGKEVKVYTATAVKIDGFELTDLTISSLIMKELREEEIIDRINNPKVLKKAGAFSIRDVLSIKGDMNSVMGLNTSFVEEMYKAYIQDLEYI